MDNNSELIIYTTEYGRTQVDVRFDDDTVWLTQEQMAELFQRDKSTISRHIKDILGYDYLRRIPHKILARNPVQNLGGRNHKRVYEKRLCHG